MSDRIKTIKLTNKEWVSLNLTQGLSSIIPQTKGGFYISSTEQTETSAEALNSMDNVLAFSTTLGFNLATNERVWLLASSEEGRVGYSKEIVAGTKALMLGTGGGGGGGGEGGNYTFNNPLTSYNNIVSLNIENDLKLSNDNRLTLQLKSNSDFRDLMLSVETLRRPASDTNKGLVQIGDENQLAIDMDGVLTLNTQDSGYLKTTFLQKVDFQKTLNDKIDPVYNWKTQKEAQYDGYDARISANAQGVSDNAQQIIVLNNKIDKVTSPFTLIGVIDKSKDEVEADKETILNEFVNIQTGKAPKVGDLVITNDKWDYFYTKDGWSSASKGEITYASITEAGIVKLKDEFGYLVGEGSEGLVKVKGIETLALKTDVTQEIETAKQTLTLEINKKANSEDVYTKAQADELFATKANLTLTDNKIGSLETLTTTNKTSLVLAVNEVKEGLDSKIGADYAYSKSESDNKYATKDNLTLTDNKIGTLASLTTTSKDNLVLAVNEVNAGLTAKADANAVYTKIEADDKFALKTSLGELTDLTTNNKDSLVLAINEVNAKASSPTGNLVTLDTDQTITASKIFSKAIKYATAIDPVTENELVRKGYLDAQLANKADTTYSYSKAESDEKYAVKGDLTLTDNKIGTLSNLTTTNKANLVLAINEVNSNVANKVSNETYQADKQQLTEQIQSVDAKAEKNKEDIATINASLGEVKTSDKFIGEDSEHTAEQLLNGASGLELFDAFVKANTSPSRDKLKGDIVKSSDGVNILWNGNALVTYSISKIPNASSTKVGGIKAGTSEGQLNVSGDGTASVVGFDTLKQKVTQNETNIGNMTTPDVEGATLTDKIITLKTSIDAKADKTQLNDYTLKSLFDETVDTKVNPTFQWMTENKVKYDGYELRITTNEGNITVNTEAIAELRELIKSVETGLTLVGQIDKSYEEVTADKDNLLNSLVQEKKQRAPKNGDIVWTNDFWVFVFVTDAWTNGARGTITYATTQTAGLVKLKDEFGYLVADPAGDGLVKVKGIETLALKGEAYTKAEADDKFSTKVELTATDSKIGTLNNLTTNAKDNLVLAINEVNAKASSTENFVTTDTVQTITAKKTFDTIISYGSALDPVSENDLIRKGYLDAQLANKADTTYSYSKGESDAKFATIASLTLTDNKIGTLGNLTTTAKDNLVLAINEVKGEVDKIDLSNVVTLNDDQTITSNKAFTKPIVINMSPINTTSGQLIICDNDESRKRAFITFSKTSASRASDLYGTIGIVGGNMLVNVADDTKAFITNVKSKYSSDITIDEDTQFTHKKYVDTQLANKANTGDVYTKSQADNKFASKLELTLLESNVGTLGELTTTAKDSIVNAINEVNAEVDEAKQSIQSNAQSIAANTQSIVGINTSIGTLGNLSTTAKDNLVNAINEVNNKPAPNNMVTTNTEQTVTARKIFSERAYFKNSPANENYGQFLIVDENTTNKRAFIAFSSATSESYQNLYGRLGIIGGNMIISVADKTKAIIADTKAKYASDITIDEDTQFVHKKYVDTQLANKANNSSIGTLGNLTTTAKDNLVNAINEVNAKPAPSNMMTTDTVQEIDQNALKKFNGRVKFASASTDDGFGAFRLIANKTDRCYISVGTDAAGWGFATIGKTDTGNSDFKFIYEIDGAKFNFNKIITYSSGFTPTNDNDLVHRGWVKANTLTLADSQTITGEKTISGGLIMTSSLEFSARNISNYCLRFQVDNVNNNLDLIRVHRAGKWWNITYLNENSAPNGYRMQVGSSTIEQKIINVVNPTNAKDAANKQYVDTKYNFRVLPQGQNPTAADIPDGTVLCCI